MTNISVFVGYAHSFANIAVLNAQIDNKNLVTKRAIYCVTLDRKLNEYFKTIQT